MNVLKVKGLEAGIEEKTILKGLDLEINNGEIHVIMGPNGSGKSTLANVLMGHPAYEVTAGTAEFLGEDLFELEVDERARKGMFLSFQYPEEIDGISNEYFITTAHQMHTDSSFPSLGLKRKIESKMKELKLDESYLQRSLNVGFSGGEKKKNEILQMSILKPKLAILDETDSGLDVDAIKVVYEEIQKQKGNDISILIITHYSRILKYIEADFVHLFVDGKIVKTGSKEFAEEIDELGYEKLL